MDIAFADAFLSDDNRNYVQRLLEEYLKDFKKEL